MRNVNRAIKKVAKAVEDDRRYRSAQTKAWLLGSRRRKAAVTRAERRLGKAVARHECDESR